MVSFVPRISTLALLLSAVLAATISVTSLRSAHAVPIDLAFDVYRYDKRIGSHTVAFREIGDQLEVEIQIELTVRVAFIPVYRYRHSNIERWQDGRLISLQTRTDDNGRELAVTGVAQADKFIVDGAAGRLILPANIAPTSYWNADTMSQQSLLDTQNGRLLAVEIAPNQNCGAFRSAQSFNMTGALRLCLGYSGEGTWTDLNFTLDSGQFVYKPVAVASGGLAGRR